LILNTRYIKGFGQFLDVGVFRIKDYDRIQSNHDGAKMSVIKTDGQKTELTKQEYINIMDAWGHLHGFETLHRKVEHHSR